MKFKNNRSHFAAGYHNVSLLMDNVKKALYALEIIFGYFPAAFFYSIMIPILFTSGIYGKEYFVWIDILIISIFGLFGLYGVWTSYNWLIGYKSDIPRKLVLTSLFLGCIASVFCLSRVGFSQISAFFFLLSLIVSFHIMTTVYVRYKIS